VADGDDPALLLGDVDRARLTRRLGDVGRVGELADPVQLQLAAGRLGGIRAGGRRSDRRRRENGGRRD
jgi:hypothetical protein